ncbi:hypothetical protein VSS37_09575 [Candidatus Thiothrix sp. Deng01]|uniref:Uncharacterized protein n=1 Tax=Candidatus Thiothrix phosphatis TaxID=3112415 RepID=A0ABU6CWL4_9GAMM|nr:hypothetical protein [Candidatus Thiothrix sp. Deng01]MEB4591225.1 hypothetical protein [Candidatus Thiothrix sp. Deng01]
MSTVKGGMIGQLELLATQASELRTLLEVMQEHIMEDSSLTIGNLTSIATRISILMQGGADDLIRTCRQQKGAVHE